MQGMKIRRLLPGAALAACALLMALPAASLAAEGDPYLDGCFTTNDTAPCTAGTVGTRPAPVLISPDGRFVYAAVWPFGGNGGGVVVYRRNTTTGQLTFSSCITSNGNGGECATGGGGYGDPWGMAMDRDGESVYVATFGHIQAFQRNSSNGRLTPEAGTEACHGPTVGCTAMRGTSTVFALLVSPDGESLYARGGNALLVFTRHSNGELTQKDGDAGCLTETAVATCKDVIGLGSNGFQMAMSPDGEYLYVPIQSPGGVSTFERFSDGTLLQRNGTDGGCITTDGSSSGVANICKDGNDAMFNGLAVTIDPDGENVYLGGSNGVFAFSRHPESGLLTDVGCVTEGPTAGCEDGRGVAPLALNMQVTEDGSELISYAAGGSDTFGPGSVAFLHRNGTTGALTQRVGQRGCIHHSGLGGACLTLPLGGDGSVAISDNGLNVYVGSVQFGTLATIDRDFAPTCQNGTVAVPHNTATAVSFVCSDVNGDALTYSITQNPATGLLGAIEQSNKRVFYNPFLGFTGSDSFRFRARGRGVNSNTATITANVAGPPPPPPTGGGGGGGLDADGDGFFAGQDCNDGNAGIRPGAQEVVGNSTDENCDGIATPFPTITSAVGNNWAVAGRRVRLTELIARRVPAGAKGQVRCKGKKCKFKRKNVKKKGTSINFFKALKKKQRKFRAGQTLEVRVTAPNMIGKVVRYKLKAGKIPKGKTLCLPVGSNRPQRCS